MINSANQVSMLIERELFADMEGGDPRDKKAIPKKIEVPSVVRMINAARVDLRTLSYNIINEPDARDKILPLAKLVATASFIGSDVALACILLSQEESYASGHCVETAIVSILIAKALKESPDEITKLGAAALMMNLSMRRQQERLQDKSEALTETEQELISLHPENTVNQLRSVTS